jgi:geranylgeranyl pyrophosphate synthase
MHKDWDIPAPRIVEILGVVSKAAGTEGLIGGQALDIRGDILGDIGSDKLEPDLEAVDKIHREKTAALIAASMETGALMAGATEEDRVRVRRAGIAAGRAFQIIDDVLDIETDAATLGKTPGKDARDGKLTYPSVIGVEASRKKAADLIADAGRELGEGSEMGFLLKLFEFLVNRRA